jgi:hypothetical protein
VVAVSFPITPPIATHPWVRLECSDGPASVVEELQSVLRFWKNLIFGNDTGDMGVVRRGFDRLNFCGCRIGIALLFRECGVLNLKNPRKRNLVAVALFELGDMSVAPDLVDAVEMTRTYSYLPPTN